MEHYRNDEDRQKRLDATQRWREKNRDKIREQSRRYWSVRKDQMSEKNRRKYERHGERLREKTKAYYRANREKCLQLKNRARIEAIGRLGGKCARCGYREDVRALQIDHINNDGFKDRRGAYALFRSIVVNGSQGLYQVLCANCNWIKHLEFKKASRGKAS